MVQSKVSGGLNKKIDVVEHKDNVKSHITDKLNEDGATNQIATLPNAISSLRLILVPLSAYFLATFHDITALIIIAVCGVSDFLDGFLARKLQQTTKLGKILDPIADRLLIFVTMFMLVWRDFIPVWFVLAVLLRETALFFQYAQLILHGKEPIRVKLIGKVGAAALMILMPLVVLFNSEEISGMLFPPSQFVHNQLFAIEKVMSFILWCLMLVALIVYWIAGILYCNDAAKILASEPSKRLIFISGIITLVIASIFTLLVIFVAYDPFGV